MYVIALALVCATIVVLALKGVNITINHEHHYHYPEQPPVSVQPLEQPEDDGTKAIVEAAQAIQRFMLDDDQIDLPEVKHNG
jgi:hypothetical protein